MSFTHYPNRAREPLGGRESAGFDEWLTDATRKAREIRETLRNLSLSNAERYVSVGAERHYAGVLSLWRNLQQGHSPNVIDAYARDDFEVKLIADVMGNYGALEFARGLGWKSGEWNGKGRPMVDVEATYARSCLVLAAYVGTDASMVTECGEDQDRLCALRAT